MNSSSTATGCCAFDPCASAISAYKPTVLQIRNQIPQCNFT
jgi:hypothetical protein